MRRREALTMYRINGLRIPGKRVKFWSSSGGTRLWTLDAVNRSLCLEMKTFLGNKSFGNDNVQCRVLAGCGQWRTLDLRRSRPLKGFWGLSVRTCKHPSRMTKECWKVTVWGSSMRHLLMKMQCLEATADEFRKQVVSLVFIQETENFRVMVEKLLRL